MFVSITLDIFAGFTGIVVIEMLILNQLWSSSPLYQHKSMMNSSVGTVKRKISQKFIKDLEGRFSDL